MATTSSPQMPILGGDTDLSKYYRAPEPKQVDWEKICPQTYRLKVQGGWLYKVHTQFGDGLAMTFVPEK